MKKILLIALVAVLIAGGLAVSAAYAQTAPPPGLARGQTGPLHTYIVAAFAERLGLSTSEVNSRLAAGENMYQIALSAGVRAENFQTLMVEVRTRALSAAVKDGVLTQTQADFMLQHMAQNGYRFGFGMMGSGNAYGWGNGGTGGRWRGQTPNR